MLRIAYNAKDTQPTTRKIQPKNYPVVPTEFTEKWFVGRSEMAPGWYPIKINELGQEVFNGREVRQKDFQNCLLACTVHNKTMFQMSETDSAAFFALHRGTFATLELK